MQATVNIFLKEGILDPQGRAIARSLGDLGFSEVNDVRVGKQILLEIDETDPARCASAWPHVRDVAVKHCDRRLQHRHR
ncbi:MAG: hypothetical protein CM15mP46_7490 [Alphaproteobacteria bacterium]|nr:MAG: hypothetical protein CM15mP46_7490 [Alphaproteobacteria bacterium]